MNDSDISHLVEQLSVKNPEFISVPLNDDGATRDKKVSLLLDGFLDCLTDTCGDSMPAYLDMRNELKKVYYHAKLCIAQNPKYRKHG